MGVFSADRQSAVVSYVLNLLGVFVLALIIEALSPYFGGVKDRIQASQARRLLSPPPGGCRTCSTCFRRSPSSRSLGSTASTSLYRGLPRVMKAPQEKAVLFTIVVIIVTLIVYMIHGDRRLGGEYAALA